MFTATITAIVILGDNRIGVAAIGDSGSGSHCEWLDKFYVMDVSIQMRTGIVACVVTSFIQIGAVDPLSESQRMPQHVLGYIPKA